MARILKGLLIVSLLVVAFASEAADRAAKDANPPAVQALGKEPVARSLPTFPSCPPPDADSLFQVYAPAAVTAAPPGPISVQAGRDRPATPHSQALVAQASNDLPIPVAFEDYVPPSSLQSPPPPSSGDDAALLDPAKQSHYTGREESGPDIPFAVLASMVDNDPWEDTFSTSDDNPFTHVIFDMTGRGGSSANGSGTSSNSNSSSQQSTENQTQGQSGNSQGNTDQRSNGGSTSGGADQQPVDQTQTMVFWSESGVNKYATTRHIGNELYALESGQTMKLETVWFPLNRSLDQALLLDDFNGDGLTDILVSKSSQRLYQVYLNSGDSWIPLAPASLPYRPTAAARFHLLHSTAKNLVFYSSELKIMDIFQDFDDGTFESIFRFPLPGEYDGLSTTDMNNDGFEDLALLNLANNRVNYLLNINGKAFRPLAGNLAYTVRGTSIRFKINSTGEEAKATWCTYGVQNLLYLENDRYRSIMVATLNPLDPSSCLLLGDFNQDGLVEIGVGHRVN